MSRLGRKMASEWKEWANNIIKQHNKSTKDILHKLASNLHAQAQNMCLYMSCITKDMTWARANGIHMALIMVSTTDHLVTWMTNGVVTNSQAVKAFFKSLAGSNNTVLVKRLCKFIASYNGVPERPQGAFQLPQTPKTHDDCRSSL